MNLADQCKNACGFGIVNIYNDGTSFEAICKQIESIPVGVIKMSKRPPCSPLILLVTHGTVSSCDYFLNKTDGWKTTRIMD